MEIALTIIAVLGGLLFIFSYIKFALTGFRYHPVTGLIALIPVLNLITVPTLLDKKLTQIILSGIVGLIFAAGAWVLGADKSLQKHISLLRGQPTHISITDEEQLVKKQITSNPSKTSKEETTAEQQEKTEIAVRAVSLVALPKKALYSMEFVDAPAQQINTLKGRIVYIITRKNIIIEGRVQNIKEGSVFILKKGTRNIIHEMLISNIKQLRVMVRRNTS